MINLSSQRKFNLDLVADLEESARWEMVGEEALDLLREYVRFPTVNDPDGLDAERAEHSPWLAGREEEAARWLAKYLRAEGIATELLEAAPGRLNLIARLPGTGDGRAITLLSHSDVVPAKRGEWESDIDPFTATVRGDYLYGRGTLDLKGLGIAHLMTLLLLSRQKVPLRRDVVLLIVADEETGGQFGAEWLLRQRPELFDTEVVLGEGGYSPRGLLPGMGTIHAISVAEKGYLELELSVEGKSHHASMPAPNDAPARLINGLARVLTMRNDIRLTPAPRALLKHLANGATGLHRLLLKFPEMAVRLAPRRISASSIVGAMLKDTIALTILESGHKSNVIPGQARAILSIRFLPGTNVEGLIDKIRRALDDPEVRIKRLKYKPANASDFTTPQFKALLKHAGAEEADALVTPILSPGASDCRFWRQAHVNCYGWIPFVIPGSDLHSVHGPNERISIAAFRQGIKSMYRAVAEMAMTA
jgi:acetylornithine deacetylase/succinyl-diaminopimelate desuccinylase-like protein